MARKAVILYQVHDALDSLWDVREERPTVHGWPVLLGWPADSPRGQGGGGPRVVPTQELADYFDAHRLAPGQMDLPLGRTAIKRLRKLLALDWRKDNAEWWQNHCCELSAPLEDFAEAHGKSLGAASTHRRTTCTSK